MYKQIRTTFISIQSKGINLVLAIKMIRKDYKMQNSFPLHISQNIDTSNDTNRQSFAVLN